VRISYNIVSKVAFDGKGAARFMASLATATDGGAIERRLDCETDPVSGTLKVKPTGSLDKWDTQSCDVSGAEGVRNVILKFTGGTGESFDSDRWRPE
jgi:arabinoxylan arabinofuranohydrolase